MRAIAKHWLAGAALALAAPGLAAQSLPMAKPEDVRLSSERLARMMQSPKHRTVYRSVLRNVVYAAVEK